MRYLKLGYLGLIWLPAFLVTVPAQADASRVSLSAEQAVVRDARDAFAFRTAERSRIERFKVVHKPNQVALPVKAPSRKFTEVLR
jgi:hypothetical protein